MKVLLVDDEKHVREAIKLLANWTEYGVDEILEAADGQEAIAMIKAHSPNIVMTDMRMPKMDGVGLLEWIYANTPHIKVLVISGYDDFDLVRHTIRTGGIDYILKPIDPDQLNEALDKAVSAWWKTEDNRLRTNQQNIEINQMKPFYADRLLSDLLNDIVPKEGIIQKLQEEFKLPSTISNCTVALISTSQFDEEINKKFHTLKHLLSFTLTNICNEILSTRQQGIAFHHLGSPDEIIILIWNTTLPTSMILEHIHKGIDLTLHRQIHIGVGSEQPFPQGIKRSYQDAQQSLWGRNLFRPEHSSHLNFFHYNSVLNPSSPRLHLTANEEKLRIAALSKSHTQMTATIDAWINDVIRLEVVTPIQLRQWNAEWEWLIKGWIDGCITDSEEKSEELPTMDELKQSLPLNKQGMLLLPLWRAQWEEKLVAVSVMITQQHSKDTHLIHDIAQYLEQHYHKDISLQDIAGRFYLSREYISRKFKQEFGITLSDFLGNIRIEKAKLLLLNPHFRISQVAEMVGYQDEKYFSKVFKKLTGQTPNEYRKENVAT